MQEIFSTLNDKGFIREVTAQVRPTTFNQDKIYNEYLLKAAQGNYGNIESLRAIYTVGTDSVNRPVVLLLAHKLNVKNLDMEQLLLYIIRIMDPIVTSDYVLIYYHAALAYPSFSWLKTAYTIFNRKYKKNLKQLYIVQPSRWFRLIAGCFKPFLSTKFWNKLVYVNNSKVLLPLLARITNFIRNSSNNKYYHTLYSPSYDITVIYIKHSTLFSINTFMNPEVHKRLSFLLKAAEVATIAGNLELGKYFNYNLKKIAQKSVVRL